MSFIINPGEVACALELTAGEIAADLDGVEQLVAKLPASPGIQDTLHKLRRRGELVAMAAVYFREIELRPETPVEFPRHYGPCCSTPDRPSPAGTVDPGCAAPPPPPR